MIRSGRSYLCRMLYIAAVVASPWNPEIRTFYQRLLAARGHTQKTGPHRLYAQTCAHPPRYD
jgi:hypothetical protein